jgi:hypothetical protein
MEKENIEDLLEETLRAVFEQVKNDARLYGVGFIMVTEKLDYKRLHPSDVILNFKSKPKQKPLTAPPRVKKDFALFTLEELQASKGKVLVFDVECYPNYFLIAFKCIETNKVIYFELTDSKDLDFELLWFVLLNFCLVGFNSINYDVPVIFLALSGASCETLKDATDDLILYNYRRQELEEKYKFKILPLNHVDLIEVAPLKASLKVYGGRLHCERMQDLPYDPNVALTASQIDETRLYCLNDLDLTALLCKELCPQLELRAQMSSEYGQDLRSKSDAQIAECVISEEVAKVNGRYSKRPKIAPGTVFKYNVPAYIKYQSEQLNDMLETVRNAEFVVKENGSIEEPEEFKELKKVKIGETYYRMGIGGLHSNEENVHYKIKD